MKPYTSVRVAAPDGQSVVEIDVFDEHHMGAVTTRTRLTRPVDGVSEFFATGGNAVFSDDSRWLILYDRTLVIACDWAGNGATFHFSPPAAVARFLFLERRRPRYVTDLAVTQTGVRLVYETGFHTHSEVRQLAFGGPEWQKGLGTACHGVFPSTYEPDVRSARAATG